MAIKDKELYKEYMRDYMLRRYYIRRMKFIEILGGKCVICGSNENLQFDHKDPAIKEFEIGDRLNSASEKVLLEELKKCQLLCARCHSEKTQKDLSIIQRIVVHDGPCKDLNGKCEICKRIRYDLFNSKRKNERRKRGLKRREAGLVHGTPSGYNYYKCRCDICRNANTERSKMWRAKIKRTKGANEESNNAVIVKEDLPKIPD